MIRFWLALLFTAAAYCDQSYELAGKFSPEGHASVSLFGVATPFTVSTLTEDGRFTFKKLQPGAYTVSIFMPEKGEARQTIEVGPGTADSRNRVQLTLDLRESDFVLKDSLRRRHSVSTRQLAVPEKAVREYEDAQKKLARREIEAAIRHLERAVSLAPGFSAAWNNLGTIAYQTRSYERAAECFRAALDADPAAYEPLVNLGGVLVNLNQLDDAWKYNAFAVLTRPNDALAHSQLGMTYFGLGNVELAEKHFLEARKLDPAHFSHPQLFLAEIHLRRQQTGAAADDLEEFLKYHPDWPQAEAMRRRIAEWRR